MAHSHAQPTGLLGWISQIFHLNGHSHDHPSLAEESAFQTNTEAIRTVWLALLALGLTSVLQIGIVALSGSVALLADTVHNIGDTLNSIPLLLAFYLSRRAATRRYTYGFGRAEDVAGVLIVLSIIVSAGVIFWESLQKLFNPQPMQNIPWVVAAAIIGFLGNEAVAWLQIRQGRKMNSEAMIADGLHARIDGLTSLAVLVAALGTAIGLPILDPIIGLMIGVTIVFITRDATKRIWYRFMDAVDPSIVNQIEHHATETEGIHEVKRLRVRWVGHQLFAEITLTAEDQLSFVESDQIAERVQGRLKQAISALQDITLRIEPRYKYETESVDQKMVALNILPQRYQISMPNAAPMGAAALKLDTEGNAAWNEIWTDFCDLALAGGPSHRGTLLEPVNPAEITADPEGYERVLRELERGIGMVTGRPVVRSASSGWIGMECDSEEMALWLLRAIIVENISVRREEKTLYFPAGPSFRLDKEIKNVITVIAKTTHYWKDHATTLTNP